MDEELSRAVIEVFVRLHDEGLIYRGKRLVNWDPVLLTALSDLEVQSAGGGRPAVAPALSARRTAAVTWWSRPPGRRPCSATRRWRCIPRTSATAHLDRAAACACRSPTATIPVIADDYVDPAFGSGCVKITPAHDFNDYEVGLRHDLPLINIFTPRAALNDDGAGALPRPRSLRGAQARRGRARRRRAARARREAPPHRAARRSQRRACSSPISPTSGT